MAMFPCNVGESGGGGQTVVKLTNRQVGSWQERTFNVSSYPGYENFTKANFIVTLPDVNGDTYLLWTDSSGGLQTSHYITTRSLYGTYNIHYDPTTGILTVPATELNESYSEDGSSVTHDISIPFSYDVYLVY